MKRCVVRFCVRTEANSDKISQGRAAARPCFSEKSQKCEKTYKKVLTNQ